MTGACPPNPTRIKASDPDPFDGFGIAVSIRGDLALVGAFLDNQNGADAGAAYLFQWDGTVWGETQKLGASDGTSDSWFGFTVTVADEVALIGALQHDHDGKSGNGPVYAFLQDEDGGGWEEIQELMPRDGAPGDGFSFSIALSGDTAVIGAPAHDDNGINSGSVYVFGFDGAVWVQEQELIASNPTFSDGLGLSVAVSGVVIVAGSPGHDGVDPKNAICDSGAAYVFRYDEKAKAWEEEAKLTASDAVCGSYFGEGVAVSGDVVFVGAPIDKNDNGPDAGSVYVFRFDSKSSEWIEQQKLLASDGLPGDQFGRTLAMDDDLAVIGAPFADPLGSSSGAAYVFRRNALGVWIEQCKLVPNPNPWGQDFAVSLDIDGQRVIIGATGEDQLQGAAYIFDLSFNPADLDADGTVGPFDLALLLGNWSPCPGPCTPGDPAQTCPADLNGDCTVEAFDLANLLGSWGP